MGTGGDDVSALRWWLRRRKVQAIQATRWMRTRGPAPMCRTLCQVMPLAKVPDKPRADLRLVTWLDARYLPLLRECLASIARTWPELPRVTVVADVGTDVRAVGRVLDGWRDRADVVPFDSVAGALHDAGHDEVLRLVEAYPGALGRKFAVLAWASLQPGRALWCDVDVLWLGPPPGLDDGFAGQRLPRTAVERVESIDPEVYAIADIAPGQGGYINSGIVLLEGPLVDDWLADVIRRRLAGPPLHWFTEQSLVAVATWRRGGVWQPGAVTLDCDPLDARGPRRTSHCFARHYTSPVRHLLWRDALLARLSLLRG